MRNELIDILQDVATVPVACIVCDRPTMGRGYWDGAPNVDSPILFAICRTHTRTDSLIDFVQNKIMKSIKRTREKR
jgi:hypothetical protein